MSRIILPNGNGTESRSLKRGSDFVTMDELVQLLGPQAQLLMEFHERLIAIETHLGIPLPDDPPSSPQPIGSGDIE